MVFITGFIVDFSEYYSRKKQCQFKFLSDLCLRTKPSNPLIVI